MKLDGLLSSLDSLHIRAEAGEDVKLELLILLVAYINNPKVAGKVDEIPF